MPVQKEPFTAMADIFREIDEEVRRDKALEFWKRHGNKLIALAISGRARDRGLACL